MLLLAVLLFACVCAVGKAAACCSAVEEINLMGRRREEIGKFMSVAIKRSQSALPSCSLLFLLSFFCSLSNLSLCGSLAGRGHPTRRPQIDFSQTFPTNNGNKEIMNNRGSDFEYRNFFVLQSNVIMSPIFNFLIFNFVCCSFNGHVPSPSPCLIVA